MKRSERVAPDSAEGAQYQGKCERSGVRRPDSAEGAQYYSQGQVRAKRARRPWLPPY
jgi:hypothetical protein